LDNKEGFKVSPGKIRDRVLHRGVPHNRLPLKGEITQPGIRPGKPSMLSEWAVYLSMVTRIFPLAKQELSSWEQRAREIPDPELRRQALASIHNKGFHSVGGAVYALVNRPVMKRLARAIVAIQTISDYLDNLCDRGVFEDCMTTGENAGQARLHKRLHNSKAAGSQSFDHSGTVQPFGLKAGFEGSGDAGLARPYDLKAASQAFSCSMRLHEALLCAVDPARPVCDYYSLYPIGNDGGYLDELVRVSRSVLGSLKNYSCVKPLVVFFARMYSEMQSIKHLPTGIRDTLMEEWFSLYSGKGLPGEAVIYDLISGQPGFAFEGSKATASVHFSSGFASRVNRLKWWEFGAAAGSTLGIFSLISYSSLRQCGTAGGKRIFDSHCSICGSGKSLAAGSGTATRPVKAGPGRAGITEGAAAPTAPGRAGLAETGPSNQHCASCMASAYFPSVCALHILLDYFIDQEEDKEFGDLNFVSYYDSTREAIAGLKRFTGISLEKVRSLPEPWFHTAVIRGLLAMYLSDPKVKVCGLSALAGELASRGGAGFLRVVCGLARTIAGI